jgi:hypothetical protein
MDTPILIEIHSTLSLRAKLWLLCKIYFRKILKAFADIYEWFVNPPKVTKTWVASRQEIAEAVWSGNMVVEGEQFAMIVYCANCNRSFGTTSTHMCARCGKYGTIDHYVGDGGKTIVPQSSCSYTTGPTSMSSYYPITQNYIDLRYDTYANNTTFRKAQGEVDYYGR